jgi:hypothetical protein
LPLGSGVRSSDGASVQPSSSEALSSAFVEQAKRPALAPWSRAKTVAPGCTLAMLPLVARVRPNNGRACPVT